MKNKVMRDIISLLGRLSFILLLVIGFEGLITLGNAFEFCQYSLIAWIAQILVLIICIWIAIMWHDESEL